MGGLELSLIRNALLKASWKLKIKYILLSLIYYPFLLIEEKRNKKRGKVDAEASAAGDDVYPLF